MEIATLIIVILSLLIIIALMGIVNRILTILEFSPNSYEEEQSNDSEDFVNGIQYAWIATQVALYKMYSEQTILDFETLKNELNDNFKKFQDQEYFSEWQKKLSDYIQEKKD